MNNTTGYYLLITTDVADELAKSTTNNLTAKEIAIHCSAIVLLVISGYMFASLVFHQWKNNYRQLPRIPSHSLRLRRNTSNLSLSNFGSALKNQNLDAMNLLVAFTVTLRCLHETIHAFIQPFSDVYCTVFLRLHIILYGLAVAAVYIFLWMRQRNIYNHPVVSYDLPCAKVLSVTVILLMVASVTATVVIFFLTRNYRLDNGSCVVQPVFKIYSIVPWIVLAAFAIIFQLILMVMFIYPLLHHRRMMNGSAANRPTDQYDAMMKRIAIAAGICVASDIFAVIVTFFTNVRVSNFIYDVNLVVDLICVCCSFTDWKKRLFFCCLKSTDDRNKNNGGVSHIF